MAVSSPPSPRAAERGSRPLIAIVGATGTGKSALGVDLARSLVDRGITAEIVNADAMQLYRGMDIGTAKLTDRERAGIRHHLLDVCAVTDEASVSWYQTAARTVIEELWHRGVVPILVGGSGLYVSAVLFDFDFPGHDDAIRRRLETELESSGLPILVHRLREEAPEVAALIDARNARRVVRALEVLELTGDASRLGHLDGQGTEWTSDVIIVRCQAERDVLVRRLDERVEAMWRRGLVDEVRRLIPEGIADGVTARRAIGYAQALGQIDGTVTEAEAIAETQALTRRYARRQVSWFRRYAATYEVDTTDARAWRLESSGVDAMLTGNTDPGTSPEVVAERLASAYLAGHLAL